MRRKAIALPALMVTLMGMAPCLSGGVAAQETHCADEVPARIMAGPTFTPYHVAPLLIDREWFLSALDSAAVAAAKADSLASMQLWVLVTSHGCVARVVVKAGSGDAAVDSLVVARWRRAEYTRPLLRYGERRSREEAVPVWIVEPFKPGAS